MTSHLNDRVAVARREALDRNFGVTQQILSVHHLVMDNGEPRVNVVEDARDLAATFVFFELVDEKYHFWVRVGRESGEVEFAGVEPLTGIELVIVSESVTAEEITSRLGIAPTTTRVLGIPLREGGNPSRQHAWIWAPLDRRAGFFEDRLREFVTRVQPLVPGVQTLHDGCSVEVSIVSYQWQAWPSGFHLDTAAQAAISALGASVDIDLYCTGPPEAGG